MHHIYIKCDMVYLAYKGGNPLRTISERILLFCLKFLLIQQKNLFCIVSVRGKISRVDSRLNVKKISYAPKLTAK